MLIHECLVLVCWWWFIHKAHNTLIPQDYKKFMKPRGFLLRFVWCTNCAYYSATVLLPHQILISVQCNKKREFEIWWCLDWYWRISVFFPAIQQSKQKTTKMMILALLFNILPLILECSGYNLHPRKQISNRVPSSLWVLEEIKREVINSNQGPNEQLLQLSAKPFSKSDYKE